MSQFHQLLVANSIVTGHSFGMVKRDIIFSGSVVILLEWPVTIELATCMYDLASDSVYFEEICDIL